MNARYREYLASAPNSEEAREALVECARSRGVRAASDMSGAHPNTVRLLLERAGAGARPLRGPGRPRLSPEDEARIVDARRAHPEAGADALKRDHGLPYGRHQIERVIREAGLIPRHRKRSRLDAEEWRLRREKDVLFARIELYLATTAREHGMTGRIADVALALRNLERAERMATYWSGRAGLACRRPLTEEEGPMAATRALERLAEADGEPGPSGEPGNMTSAVDVGEPRAGGRAGVVRRAGRYDICR
ncbi:MAG: transposase [Planctomycetota bacterium]|jgi:transposase